MFVHVILKNYSLGFQSDIDMVQEVSGNRGKGTV